MSTYHPTTGQRCGCRPGIWRDNCPQCEGTGKRIDFAAIHAERGLTVARIIPSGAWQVSAIIGGHLVTRTYYGYTRREAVMRYRQETDGDA